MCAGVWAVAGTHNKGVCRQGVGLVAAQPAGIFSGDVYCTNIGPMPTSVHGGVEDVHADELGHAELWSWQRMCLQQETWEVDLSRLWINAAA